MLKVYYNLQNDFVDRSLGNIGLLDVLQSTKCNIYTETNQLRGEKIDIAYMNYDEKTLSLIGDLQIKKISIVIKGDDEDIVVPRNFVKYSSDRMMQQTGKYFNVILNNKNYKTDNEIIMMGDDDVHQDVVRNIYTLFGNVITSTSKKYDMDALNAHIMSRNLPNSGNVYNNVYLMLEGLKKCVIQKNIVKVRPDEHFSDLSPIIKSLQADDKLVITNLHLQKVSKIKFSFGDHIIAGKYEQLLLMYTNAMNILNNKVTEMRKKIRLEYTPEQILILGYLKDTFDFIGAKTETYAKQVMVKHFNVVPIDDLGNYRVKIGNKLLTSGKTHDKELYTSVCYIKQITDI